MFSPLLYHVLANYIVWIACVLSAARGEDYLGLNVALLLSAMQFGYHIYYHRAQCIVGLACILCILILGIVSDSLLLYTHVLWFNANPFTVISPLWMWGIWLNFAVTIFCGLQAWFRRYVVLLPCCFLGFAIAYYSGAALGAAVLLKGYISLWLVAITYTLWLPIILYVFSRYIDAEG